MRTCSPASLANGGRYTCLLSKSLSQYRGWSNHPHACQSPARRKDLVTRAARSFPLFSPEYGAMYPSDFFVSIRKLRRRDYLWLAPFVVEVVFRLPTLMPPWPLSARLDATPPGFARLFAAAALPPARVLLFVAPLLAATDSFDPFITSTPLSLHVPILLLLLIKL